MLCYAYQKTQEQQPGTVTDCVVNYSKTVIIEVSERSYLALLSADAARRRGYGVDHRRRLTGTIRRICTQCQSVTGTPTRNWSVQIQT